MSVYVDDMRRSARPAGYHGRNTPKWSHLIADTSLELMLMADTLGLRREWLQHAGTHREHYDVTETQRVKALRLGAVPIAYPHGTGDLMNRKRRDYVSAAYATTGEVPRDALTNRSGS